MSNEWDGKVVMSTPGGPIVTMSLGDLLARKDAEIERLRASLKPFAQLYLWPDDLGEDMATLLRAEADWCEATNEDADSDVFIKRRYIRAARAALEAKP